MKWTYPLKRKMQAHRAKYPDLTDDEYIEMMMNKVFNKR